MRGALGWYIDIYSYISQGPTVFKAFETQLLAKVDPDMARQFKKALIDDDVTFKSWLVNRINEYLVRKAERHERD